MSRTVFVVVRHTERAYYEEEPAKTEAVAVFETQRIAERFIDREKQTDLISYTLEEFEVEDAE